MRWGIEDPRGFIHIVDYEKDGTWHGMNNLYHSVKEDEAAWMVQHRIQRMILQYPHGGDYMDFIWIPLSSE